MLQTPEGKTEELFSMKHPGGVITIPYILPENTIIKIIVAEKEIISYSVKKGK